MRNLCILIAAALIMNTGYTQVPSNCVAPLNLKNAYEIDVSDLAIGRMFDIKSADTNQITIPQGYKDTIWHGLAAIYNSFTITERDSVFDIYCIHNYSYKTLSLFHHIYVGVDLNYLWTKQWKNLITTTYYQELDDLLSKYGFTIYHFSTLYTPSAALYTDKNINVAALCDSLLLLDGIIFAEPLNTHSDGNRVKYAKIGDDQFFDFTLAWGDCHSGCINKLKWKFKVNYPNCIVYYYGSDMY
ncbi:MAG: hypothetical protein K8S00_02415, partial [Bacteroidales bacterium]|nr:hypothetical protein [Bacteroidales bacterium]